jgi:hypothetical protein
MIRRLSVGGAFLCGVMAVGACQGSSPQAGGTPPAAPSVSASVSAPAVHRKVDLPKTIIGLAQLEPKSAEAAATQDWGMEVSLRAAFPAATATGGVGLRSEKGYAVLVGVVQVSTPDPQAAIDKAFASMAPKQGHASLGLLPPRAHSVDSREPGVIMSCGLSDGGGQDFPVCGWAGNGVVGLVAYVGDDSKYVEQRIHQIRAEVEASIAAK